MGVSTVIHTLLHNGSLIKNTERVLFLKQSLPESYAAIKKTKSHCNHNSIEYSRLHCMHYCHL